MDVSDAMRLLSKGDKVHGDKVCSLCGIRVKKGESWNGHVADSFTPFASLDYCVHLFPSFVISTDMNWEQSKNNQEVCFRTICSCGSLQGIINILPKAVAAY